jgi:hypothetical protein
MRFGSGKERRLIEARPNRTRPRRRPRSRIWDAEWAS